MYNPINFISPKDKDKKRIMYLESDNIELFTFDKTDEVIKELPKSLLYRY